MKQKTIYRFGREGGRVKPDTIFSESEAVIDYKDERLLAFLTDRLKIVPRRNSGISAKQQRRIKRAIRRARNSGLIRYSAKV
ncbi:30S ribosomal protein S18 [Candidatus Marinamargulisbacteria bacterium]|jgi:small subunit ribosomal protein S18|nr:30S ribosomal protein S18 [Candidatus Marinamargulisbacteria bacterium]